MADIIGGVAVPEIAVSGVYPLIPDYPYGRAHTPKVAVHQFGSANAKIEQRFYIGSGSKKFTLIHSRMTETDRVLLRSFWEANFGGYGSFYYDAPNESAVGTTRFTCRFANEGLSWEFVLNHLSSTGVNLIGIPTTSPTYTLNSTLSRFPSDALKTALLDQVQEIIPLVKLSAKKYGYNVMYLSDRRCTIGSQLWQARLLSWDGISQIIGNTSDQATFTFGNADRVMRELVNDVDLMQASVEFSLFHVGTGIKLDLWKGVVSDWGLDTGPEFKLSASDGIYQLNLPYPSQNMTRGCWKDFDDGNNCPFTSAHTGAIDPATGGGITPDPSGCDKGYDTPDGCLAHGMKRYFGGILIEPQGVRIKDIGGNRITSKSNVSDTIYDAIPPEIYTDTPISVPCLLVSGRDEGKFYDALGIVGVGPLGAYGTGHTLDQQYQHNFPSLWAEKSVLGSDPAGATDYFSLGQDGAVTEVPAWRRVLLSGNRGYKDNFAAGLAFLEIRRSDEAGLQLTTLQQHEMIAIVTLGLSGWTWTDSGDHATFNRGGAKVLLTNPFWIAVNMYLKVLGLQNASSADQLETFDVKALADSTTVGGFPLGAALIADLMVAPLIDRYDNIYRRPVYNDRVLIGGSFYDHILLPLETQFTFRGILRDQKPFRDWLQEVLMNCLGYYNFNFGKLRMGIRINSSTVEAFTAGNILFNSLQLNPIKPAFNHLTGKFADEEFAFATNSVTIYDIDYAKLIGGGVPFYLKSEMNLSGSSNKSQTARVITTRLREELGGVTEAEQIAARNLAFKSTILALAAEPGMVCSMTHEDMPGGLGEFRLKGWRLNQDYSIDMFGSSTTDSMYDLTVGPKPADVPALPVPSERLLALPAPTQWTLTASLSGDLRLSFNIPDQADYAQANLILVLDDEPVRIKNTLAANVLVGASSMQITDASVFKVGQFVNIGNETVQITGPGTDGAPPLSNTVTILRAQGLSTAEAHTSGDVVYGLTIEVLTLHFDIGYTLTHPTGSLANGQYYVHNFRPGRKRIVYAKLGFINGQLSSPYIEKGFLSAGWTPPISGQLPGLRTSVGDKISMVVNGPLMVGDDVADDLILGPTSIGEIFAKLGTASTGADIHFRLDIIDTATGALVYTGGTVTIAATTTGVGIFASGSETGNVEGWAFRLVILQVGSTTPGEDLTVVVTY